MIPFLIERQVAAFLKQHFKNKGPLLLGLSGGPDSLALCHILLKFKQKFQIDLRVAHVDHRWRQESLQEAKLLEKMMDTEGIPFYLKTLDPTHADGNLEAFCREQRLHFFREIYHQERCEAVLLGHHANDLAETILKRIFEGASFAYLHGIQEVVNMDGMLIWRPFLSIKKELILKYLESNQFQAFDDKTNLDPKFLRGRFRTQIIPMLSTLFGKEVTSSLNRLGQEALEIRDFLRQKVSIYLQYVHASFAGMHMNLSKMDKLHLVELKCLIQIILENLKVTLSREMIEAICHQLLNGKKNSRFQTEEINIYVDQKHIFFVIKPYYALKEKLMLEKGVTQFGDWTVHVEPFTQGSLVTTNWVDAWKGHCEVILPLGNYSLGKGFSHVSYQNRTLGKLWTAHKVPVFLRETIPVVWNNDYVIHEFLTGKVIHASFKPCQEYVRICMERKK